jgi:hypothetical protein
MFLLIQVARAGEYYQVGRSQGPKSVFEMAMEKF